MTYVISQPQETDLSELIDMYNQSWLDTYQDDESGVDREYLEKVTNNRTHGAGYQRQLDALQDSLVNPDRYMRIARTAGDKGSIVGMIDGKYTDDTYELERLYIDKSEFGTGLAHDLWHSFVAWTKQPADILVTVVASNARAIAFYKKCGFLKVEASERIYSGGIMKVIDMVRKGDSNEV